MYTTTDQTNELQELVLQLQEQVTDLSNNVLALDASTNKIDHLVKLRDVTVTDIAEGDILKYQSDGKWHNLPLSSLTSNIPTKLTELEDVNTANLQANDLMFYDAANNKFVNKQMNFIITACHNACKAYIDPLIAAINAEIERLKTQGGSGSGSGNTGDNTNSEGYHDPSWDDVCNQPVQFDLYFSLDSPTNNKYNNTTEGDNYQRTANYSLFAVRLNPNSKYYNMQTIYPSWCRFQHIGEITLTTKWDVASNTASIISPVGSLGASKYEFRNFNIKDNNDHIILLFVRYDGNTPYTNISDVLDNVVSSSGNTGVGYVVNLSYDSDKGYGKEFVLDAYGTKSLNIDHHTEINVG